MEQKVKTSAGMETASETVSRINAARQSSSSSGPTTSPADDALFSALQDTLLNSADLVSSGDSNIETAISSAVDRVNQGQDAQAGRIETDAARQRDEILRRGVIQNTDAVEGRRGFATQTAVLRDIMNTTNAELKDLDARRQDLLATGEAEAASQIANLQVQSLQLAQTAKQNAINNMIQTANSMFSFQRLQMDQSQQERDNALNTISTLQSVGTLQNSDPSTLRGLEKNAGLPDGTLSNIPEVPAEFEIRKVGSSLIAVDPTNPTNMQVIYAAPAGSGSGADVLTIEDTQDLGLPIALAGLTEEDVVNSLGSTTPPNWFVEAESSSRGQTMVPQALAAEWDKYRQDLLTRTSVPEQGDNSDKICYTTADGQEICF